MATRKKNVWLVTKNIDGKYNYLSMAGFGFRWNKSRYGKTVCHFNSESEANGMIDESET